MKQIQKNENIKVQVTYLAHKSLVLCGVLSSLIYILGDIAASNIYEGYHYTSQAVSDLGAIGSPTRPIVFVIFCIYNTLVLLFGLGLIATKKQKSVTMLTGIMFVIYAIIGQLTFMYGPMNIQEAIGAETNIEYLILAYTNILPMLFVIAVGCVTIRQKNFKLYSALTIAILILFGAWMTSDLLVISTGLPIPWYGIKERINIYGFMIWVFIFSLLYIKKGQRPCTDRYYEVSLIGIKLSS